MPATIERASLARRLKEAATFPIALIRGEAGSGKSVALRSLLRENTRQTVLYDVGREAKTFARFVRGFAEAFGELAPGARISFGSAYERAMQSLNPQRDLAAWFNEHIKSLDVTIAVDNLHNASDDPHSDAFLASLIDLTGERVRWIVATRNADALSVPVWMAFDRMGVPIEDRDLAFTAEAVAQLAAEMDIAVDHADVRAILDGTGGWATGVSAVLLARQTNRREPSAVRSFAPLVEGILASCDTWDRRALLATSFLPDLSDALLADDATRAAVRRLRESAPYVFLGDDEAPRLHDMLADALHARLAEADPRLTQAAIAAAGSALRRQSRFVEALALYAQADFFDQAVAVLERHGVSLIESGNGDVVELALERLERSGRALSASVLALRAIVESRLGRFDTAESWFNQALARSADDDERMVEITYLFACDIMRRERRDALELFESALAKPGIRPPLHVALLSARALALMFTGRPEEARAEIEAVLPRVRAIDDDALAAWVYARAAYIYLYVNQPAEAAHFAREAAELATRASLFNVATTAYSVLYAIAADAEDPVAQLASLDRLLENGVKAGDLHTHAYYAACAFEIEVERNGVEALARIDSALRSFDLQYDDGYTRDALLPAQALRASWNGMFDYAYQLLAPTAESQVDSERTALRSGEIGFYAAAAGRSDEAAVALERGTTALAATDPSNRAARAAILLALTAALLRRDDEAARLLAALDERVLATRLRALLIAARAIARRLRGERNHRALTRALREMDDAGFAGWARMLGALPAREAMPA